MRREREHRFLSVRRSSPTMWRQRVLGWRGRWVSRSPALTSEERQRASTTVSRSTHRRGSSSTSAPPVNLLARRSRNCCTAGLGVTTDGPIAQGGGPFDLTEVLYQAE